jgi:hypothetical protein
MRRKPTRIAKARCLLVSWAIWLDQGDAQARIEALVGTRCTNNTRPDNDNVICLWHGDRYNEK